MNVPIETVVPKDIRAVVIDAGDTLVRLGERTGREAWASRLGLSLSDFTHRVWDAMGSYGMADKPLIIQKIAEVIGVSEQEAESLLTDFHSHWNPDHALLDFISSLRPQFGTAVLANAGRAARFGFEEILGLHRRVDSVLISAELGVEKPEPGAFLAAPQRWELLQVNAYSLMIGSKT